VLAKKRARLEELAGAAIVATAVDDGILGR